MSKNHKLKGHKSVYTLKSMMLFGILAALLSACGNSDNKAKPYMQAQAKRKFDKNIMLTGVVSKGEDKINDAQIKVISESGVEIASAAVGTDGLYQVQVPAGTELPIIIQAIMASDPEQSGPLMVVAIDPSIKRYDINLLTTAIAKKAKELGGYTYANLSQAAMSSTSVPDVNQTTGGFSGDPTRQYGGWH